MIYIQPAPAAGVDPPVAANGLQDRYYPEDLAITAIDVASDFSGGAIDSFALHGTSDALPTGLSLNTSTGEITGTPTTVAAAATIVVEATNAGGSDTTTFDIEIGEAFGTLRGTLTVAAASITDPIAATGSVAVRIGDLVYVTVNEQTSITATAVTDNLGNTYAAVGAGTDGGTPTTRKFWSRVTVEGTLTSVSAAATASSNNVVVLAAVIAAYLDPSPLDATPADTTADITSPFTSPSTGTLAQASEIVMCHGCAETNVTTAYTATSPNLSAIQLETGTIFRAFIGYQAVAATTAVAPAWTRGSNPATCILGTTSFKRAL